MASMRVSGDSLSVCDFSRIRSFGYSASLKHPDRNSQMDKDQKGVCTFSEGLKGSRKLRTEYYFSVAGRKSPGIRRGDSWRVNECRSPWPRRNRVKTPRSPAWHGGARAASVQENTRVLSRHQAQTADNTALQRQLREPLSCPNTSQVSVSGPLGICG